MPDEPFPARCRRVLENGPTGEDDDEVAAWLIGQRLADGRVGPRSKGRNTYGRTGPVAWFGITPAGRLWLEASAGAELDQPQGPACEQASGASGHTEENGINGAARPKEPESALVAQAKVVVGGVVLALLIYLIKTHFGIPL